MYLDSLNCYQKSNCQNILPKLMERVFVGEYTFHLLYSTVEFIFINHPYLYRFAHLSKYLPIQSFMQKSDTHYRYIHTSTIPALTEARGMFNPIWFWI